MQSNEAIFQVGVARTCITPPPGVELAGLGYYLGRVWDRINDDLNATALVVTDQAGESVAIVALDIMKMDAHRVLAIRNEAAKRTGLRPEAICINTSHSHNSPTLAFFDGAGEISEPYYAQMFEATVAVLEKAWKSRRDARLSTGFTSISGLTYNRTRDHGPVDERISVLRADTPDGKPLAAIINFHAHPTVFWQVENRSISRDWPGMVVDQIENALPGITALYVQGTCGDVNILLEYWTEERYREPADIISSAALKALSGARPVTVSKAGAIVREVDLPARRWTHEEVDAFYREGKHRLETGDTTDWLTGLASKVVGRPDLLHTRYGGSVERAVAAVSRFALGWAESVLPTLDDVPEKRSAEFQAIRFGDTWFIANQAELFTTLALEIRRRWPHDDLFILGYSNGSISYLPDAFEVQRGSYASLQTPKAIRQLPFTGDSGMVAVAESVAALRQLAG